MGGTPPRTSAGKNEGAYFRRRLFHETEEIGAPKSINDT
jgi:hypothetical protein